MNKIALSVGYQLGIAKYDGFITSLNHNVSTDIQI